MIQDAAGAHGAESWHRVAKGVRENLAPGIPFNCGTCRHSSESDVTEPRSPAVEGASESDLIGLLRRATGSDPVAADQLFVLLYQELHRLAEHHLRRGNAALTLGTTTLVHEAYLSMAGRSDVAFPDRERFFAYASRAMRGLVIDYSRRRCAKKRGRQFEITLTADEGQAAAAVEDTTDLPALGEALTELAALNPQLAELVDLHFFGGFSLVEIAGLRGVAERTVQRDWRKARMLLHRTLKPGDGEGGAPA